MSRAASAANDCVKQNAGPTKTFGHDSARFAVADRGADIQHTDFRALDLPQERRKLHRTPRPNDAKSLAALKPAESALVQPRGAADAARSSKTMQPPEEFGPENEDSEEYYGQAWLDFQDSRYIIKKDCLIIGRPQDGHLTLSEVSDLPADAQSAVAPTVFKGKKRKRSVEDGEDGEEEQGNSPLFHGGIGGPQEHSASYNNENAEFLSVWPTVDDPKRSPPNIKAISKRHLCIMCDEMGQWHVDVLGRNGTFKNQVFLPQGTHEVLEHGDFFWMADVAFSFYIPDENTDGYSDAEEEQNDYLYDSDESGSLVAHDNMIDSDDQELRIRARGNDEDDEDDDDEEDDDEDEEEDEDEDENSIVQRAPKTGRPVPKPNGKRPVKGSARRSKARRSVSGSDQEDENVVKEAEVRRKTKKSKAKSRKNDAEGSPTAMQPNGDDDDENSPPKKRGPGRPPKDGVMSKRARRALQKAAEAEREDADASQKQKGRPKKATESTAEVANGESKKAKKPKRAATDAAGSKADDEAATEETPKEETAPPPPPRAPSPKESDFTEQQLQRPEGAYSIHLYNILKEHGRSMALPEIYDAFKKRWPYFKFRTNGDGWQSSIRHNLQSTKCLVKDGKAGKGHLWTVDPNVPLDTKATRSEPAPMHPSYYNRPGQSSSMLGIPNQHLPMRAPNNPGSQGQPNMHQYQMTYMQANANGPRPHPMGSHPPLQQYQPAQNGGTASFALNNANAVSSPRPSVSAVALGASGSQNGTQLQRTGQANASTQMQGNQGSSSSPGAVSASNQQSNQSQVSGSQPAIPVAPSNLTPANYGVWGAEKHSVFEHFRMRLLSMAATEKVKTYYAKILNIGQAWCAQHDEIDARYDGPKQDIAQIVGAFQDAWRGHLVKKGTLEEFIQAVASAKSSSAAQPSQSSGPSKIVQSNSVATQPNSMSPAATPATNSTLENAETLSNSLTVVRGAEDPKKDNPESQSEIVPPESDSAAPREAKNGDADVEMKNNEPTNQEEPNVSANEAADATANIIGEVTEDD